MQSNYFWKEWPRPLRLLFNAILLLMTASVVWCTYYYFLGAENIIGWNKLANTERINAAINSFKVGPFTLKTSADNILFFQQFAGNALQVNVLSYYLLLGITVIGLNLYLTITSSLSRFWYTIGMGLFAFFMVNYKFELLLLFDSTEKIGLILAFILYFPLSYYFNSINSNVSFLLRMALFFICTAIFGVIIYLFSGVDQPFLSLATYGIVNPFIVTLVFIVLVAHEIITAFLYTLTKAKPTTSGNSMLHFYLISLVYLVNLVLAYLYETHVIEWDFVYINLYLLFFISAVIGIWGFRHRESQYENILKFRPQGALLYGIMFICSFSTLAHFFATLNTSALEVIRDFIIYAHLAYGVIFIIYVTSNFINPLKANLQVYKVVYKPNTMPYFTYCFAGLIGLTALFIKSNWEIPYQQGVSAYYNSIGDLHYAKGEIRLSQSYYKQGAIYGYNNHKSHYMLGTIAEQNNDLTSAALNYKAAIQKHPAPQTFINLSNLYMKEHRILDALLILNDGAKLFPKNTRLINNLGLAYGKTDLIDTAFYYLKSTLNSEIHQAASSNLIAFLAKKEITTASDSLFSDINIQNDPVTINNAFVFKNKAKAPYEKDFKANKKNLDFLNAAVIYNQAFNYLFKEDSLNTAELLALAKENENASFAESLELAASLNAYKNENISLAFKQLNWLANSSPYSAGDYFNTIGLWAMEQGAPEVAISYFKWATDKFNKEAPFNEAMALTEAGYYHQALEKWQELRKSSDTNVRSIANTITGILKASVSDYNDYEDNKKYLFLRYQLTYQDTTHFKNLAPLIKDGNYKALSYLDMAKKLWEKDLTASAINQFLKLTDLQISDKTLFNQIQWFELNMLAAEGNVRGLSTKINQGITFDKQHNIEKHYYKGLIHEANGDTTSALKEYKAIAYANPYKEDATIAAANFIGTRDRFESYNILLNAMELNPKSVKILKAYVLQSARVQLNNYAEITLTDLQQLITPAAYRNFVNEYQALVKAVEEAEQNF